ncbi:MAG TPA: chloride channel protein [Candidatus Merdivicinus intestinavium]|nr:chloride channel protein [Candidatus Merdivicinus intestinavium]
MSHDLRIFLKWTGISVLCGLPVGLVGAVFHHLVEEATLFREEHRWIIWLLPAAGVLIAWLYRAAGMETDGGTNTVLSSVRSEKELRFRTAPLIFAGTVLTHLFGGSAGREGAALQLGGSIGAQLGRWLRLDSRDRHIITLCGMSACFAALFGTPLTAAFFAMEVVSVGLMYYTAIVPCLFSALIGAGIAGQLGAVPTSFAVGEIPALSLASAAQAAGMGILCAGVSILFCTAIHMTGHQMKKLLPNSLVRAAAGGALVAAAAFLLGTTDYNGAGMDVVARALAGEARPEAFLLKILFTAVTLGAGFRGGEIVPVFFAGATFGCAAGPLLGLPAGFGGALGIAALFCGVVNCPLSSLLLCLELFGGEGMPLFAVAIAVSYLLSGYFGLYSSQRFYYSKTEQMRVRWSAW